MDQEKIAAPGAGADTGDFDQSTPIDHIPPQHSPSQRDSTTARAEPVLKVPSSAAEAAVPGETVLPARRSCTSPVAVPPSNLTAHASLSGGGLATEDTSVKDQLAVIHAELARLKARREALEAQRRKLLAANLPPREKASAGSAPPLAPSQAQGGAPPVFSTVSATASSSGTGLGVPPRPQMHALSRVSSSSRGGQQRRSMLQSTSTLEQSLAPIPSERDRRLAQQPTPQLVMKNAMREAVYHDSTCLMGDFLLEDNSQVYTFGRARRFMPVVGQRGKYYLSTEMEVSQQEKRVAERRGVAITSHESPGPGAYTPRYNKVSKPSVLTRW